MIVVATFLFSIDEFIESIFMVWEKDVPDNINPITNAQLNFFINTFLTLLLNSI